jgi:osmoprotectant transport system permease protein
VNWAWLQRNTDQILSWLVDHLWLAALLGIPQLGQLFTVGFQLDFYTPIIAGIVLCLLVAALFDAIILISARLATPWTRAVKAR